MPKTAKRIIFHNFIVTASAFDEGAIRVTLHMGQSDVAYYSDSVQHLTGMNFVQAVKDCLDASQERRP